MAAKAQIPAPIDRPLSRAYLREFSGWSTDFPPGLSEPTSLRIMENTIVNRDGSLQIRPGLRHLSYRAVPTDEAPGLGVLEQCVGTHVPFFLNNGKKAYLFAVREPATMEETEDTVGFRVLVPSATSDIVRTLSHPEVGFALPWDPKMLRFSGKTTYVKYLQIDNKIFALSNAGETMRLFNVGALKSARPLASIERPDWRPEDKLTVVHPRASWITDGVPASWRSNRILNPSVEAGLSNIHYRWITNRLEVNTNLSHVKSGKRSLKASSAPERTNWMTSPLHNVATSGIGGWEPGSGAASVVASGANAKATSGTGGIGRNFHARSPIFDIEGGKEYRAVWDLVVASDLSAMHAVVQFFGASGAQIGENQVHGVSLVLGRKGSDAFTAPSNAVSARLFIRGTADLKTACSFEFNDVAFVVYGEDTAMFTGDSGTDYFWVGTVGASASVYHPPALVDVHFKGGSAEGGKNYWASFYAKTPDTPAPTSIIIKFFYPDGTLLGDKWVAGANDTAAWTRRQVDWVAPAAAVSCSLVARFEDVPRGSSHYVDEVMIEQSASLGAYFDGDTADTDTVKHSWTGYPAHTWPSAQVTYAFANTIPIAATPTADTLVSSTPADNVFNFAYFYTFSNEVGESAASQITQRKVQRSSSAWKWETANASAEPSGTATTNPDLCADQLVAYMPQAVYDAAKAQGAISWSLYALTWSDQDIVPVEGVLLGTKEITSGGTYGSQGWIRHTPQNPDGGATAAIPSESNRFNYSNPSRGGQGIVAADRMVMVHDPVAGAVIRWSSNRMGEYTNFTANRGGGYKTLTSGELNLPAAVKLWQNPESKDTLTILCRGVDGHSSSYYMAPGQVASQTDATNLMAFEETTATPGTVAPYGCEVLNNALYHPLETELMKSTASNYNINHKSQTDAIANMWKGLQNKDRIVSATLDNRIYYVVHNPHGEPLKPGCWGNEVWVFDIASEQGTWSRWLVPAQALRKIEFNGRVVMSVVRPDGIFCFDEQKTVDDYVEEEFLEVLERPIPWRIETNTQGANRAHDAWAHLQQVSAVFGNFAGTLRYGIRGWDLNGKPIEAAKQVQDLNAVLGDGLQYDLEDHLMVRRDMKEWHFFAESVVKDAVVLPSSGQINLVQYRYTPVSVNVGYEYGSVETFEYSRNVAVGNNALFANGVPTGAVDPGRP